MHIINQSQFFLEILENYFLIINDLNKINLN